MESVSAETQGLEDLQSYWMRQINRYEKKFESWKTRVSKIVRLYKRQSEHEGDRASRRYAMLWANTEILKPAVYGQPPTPVVVRRFKQKDPMARFASEVLERALIGEAERAKLDWALRRVRDDMLLGGRGQLWVRADEDPSQGIATHFDYVHWRDFYHDPQRTWAEVQWVARRVYMTKRELADRFFEGDMTLAAKVGLDNSAGRDGDEYEPSGAKGQAKASVYEIWDRKSQQVIFIAKAATLPLEVAPPYLTLDDFWPCPMPVYATMTSDDLVPTPDYVYYQDQAEEIDQLTARIAKVSDSLKMVGFYNAGAGDISSAVERVLQPGVENVMVPVESWAAFGEGGSSGGIAWLPIDQVSACLREMIALRQRLIEDVFQTSGIADIMRGDTSPEETLGAQQIKSQWGSIRMKDKQRAMATFAASCFKIAAEIIAETFPPDQIVAMANIEPDEDPQKVMQAIGLLRDQRLRGFKIDVETDSTIYPDEQAEKAARNEFLTAVGQFMQSVVPIAQGMPALVPLLGEMLTFTVRGYRAGREMEEQIEMAVGQLQQQLQEQAQQPDPEMMKAEQELKFKQAEHDMDLQFKQEEMALKRQELQQKNAMEQEKFALQRESQSFDMAMREDEYLSTSLGGGEDGEDEVEGEDMKPAGKIKTPVSQAITSMLEQVVALQQQNAQSQQMMMQMVQALTAAITAPKRAVYDEMGRIVGSETSFPNQG
jgi:hypothetical protein